MAESKTILIFSEDTESKQVYRACAAEKEYNLIFKEKKLDALRILVMQKFDLIIDEIQKPIISEIDFFDSVYKMAGGVPITIVSEFFYETRNIIFSNKPKAFILKPLSIEKILDHFEEIFETVVVKEILADTDAKEQFTLEARKLSVLIEVSKRINSNTDLDILLESVIDVLTETLNAERATMYMLDKEKNEIWSRIGTRIKNKEIRFPAGTGIAGWVMETGVSQIVDDAYYHPKFLKEVDNQTGFLTKNILCVPIKNVQGEVTGAFELLNKKDGIFTKSDEDFLNILAVALGISIENVLLQDKLVQQIKELKQSYENQYTSQNVIIKQSKIGTLSEVQEYFIKEFKNSELLKKIEEVKNLAGEESNIKHAIEEIAEVYKQSINRTEKFFSSMKNRF